MDNPYQLLPDLTPEEYEALRESIRADGVKVAIEYDENGIVLDGHHRLRACRELGITEWPRIVRLGMSEKQKAEHVLALNLDRRHLSREQRRELVGKLRSQGWSTPRIAERLGISDETARRDISVSTIVEPAAVTGSDGKQYRARKPVSLFNPSSSAVTSLMDMPDEKREAIIDKLATGEAVSLTDARRQLARDEVHQAPPMTGKYRVIYADPPWQYSDNLHLDGYGSAEHHYPTLAIPELCLLPVKEIAEANAVLFLWVTSPLLEECFEVIRAWGFKYKTSFVWDKVRPNMGHYNRANHEFLLICTRGSCVPEHGALLDSVVSLERTHEHSEKPALFREMIESMYPSAQKIELFAREKPDGWTIWGNEV